MFACMSENGEEITAEQLLQHDIEAANAKASRTRGPRETMDRILRIERILASGGESITVDGVVTRIDRDSLRTELRRLKHYYEREFGRVRKPVIATVNLRNLMG